MSLGGRTVVGTTRENNPLLATAEPGIAGFTKGRVPPTLVGFNTGNQMKFVLFASGGYNFDEGLYRIAMANCRLRTERDTKN